eukprot:5816093-Heterocapsa_arctica.AAC.1
MRHQPAEDTGGRDRGEKGQAMNSNRAPARVFSPTAMEGSGEGWQIASGKAASSKDRFTHKEVRRDTNRFEELRQSEEAEE